MAECIEVKTPDGHNDYTIDIERGLLRQFTVDAPRVAVVTNETIAPLYGDVLAQRLNAPLIAIADGEQHKNLKTIGELYSAFVHAGLDRKSVVVALGGGVLGDTVGFAAASYMRGIEFLQIPTTLLSMVDSSVGGKVGIDLPEGKNLAGAFKQPQRVIIDPDVLETLPAKEWRNGMAEVIKHGLLADPELLESQRHSPDHAESLVARAVRVKVDVVQRDPFEKGERAHLNLGHTFGHAIEQVTEYRVAHGEGVAMGLVAACHLSHQLGMIEVSLVRRVESILEGIGLPVRLGGIDPDAVYAAMATDKKWEGGRSRFVLLEGLCKPRIVKDVPKDAIIQALADIQ